MAGRKHLDEAQAEAEAILKLDDANLSALFFAKTMKRNLSRTVRHLDELIAEGGSDKELGERALRRLGFSTSR